MKHNQTLSLGCTMLSLSICLATNSLGAATIAHWQFDEGTPGAVAVGGDSVVDDSGNDLQATPIGGPVYRASYNGTALEFDGTDDRLRIDDAPEFELTESLTIEAFVRVDAASDETQLILFRGDNRGGRDPYQLAILPDGKLQFKFHSGATGPAELRSSGILPMGEVLHVAETLDHATGEMKVFVNGVEAGVRQTDLHPFGALLPDHDPGLGIGSRQDGFDYFHGMIDEVRLSDVALDPSEFLISVPEPVSLLLIICGTGLLGQYGGRARRDKPARADAVCRDQG